ncbi:hypothetical protein VOI54_03740 [Tamlana sp. 2201CG12-4]|nr:hypothetical protein [Tamlana sp. 2201CG12-4]MEC3906115.1 hypothetical protein [Tamlana sp. 2201CG12-4]
MNEVLLKLKSRAYKIVREFRANQMDISLDEFAEVFRGKKNEEIDVITFF